MPVDLNALKKRLNELNGSNKRDKLWKPEIGKTYTVRILPPTGDSPFIERFFYYGIAPYAIMAPFQFGKEDPVKEFIDECYRSGSKEQKELVKKISPKSAVYVPIIIRGEEAKGVFLLKCSYTVHKTLLEMFFDEEVGDITDPTEGYDLTVTIEKVPGKKYPDTKVKEKKKPSVLTSDPSLLKQWVNSIPNVDEMFDLPSSTELKAKFETWLAGGGTNEDQSTGEERSTPGGGEDELSKLEAEMKKELKKPAKAVAVLEDENDEEEVDLKPTKKSSKSKALDDVFKDLESDD